MQYITVNFGWLNDLDVILRYFTVLIARRKENSTLQYFLHCTLGTQNYSEPTRV